LSAMTLRAESSEAKLVESLSREQRRQGGWPLPTLSLSERLRG